MEWLEIIFGFAIIFGCGLGIFFYGVWAGKQTQIPIGFWANGKPLNPKSVADIPGYNREYGLLFRYFSIPCLISGVTMIISAILSLIILILWGVFGIWWLIRSYKRIEKKYILQ